MDVDCIDKIIWIWVELIFDCRLGKTLSLVCVILEISSETLIEKFLGLFLQDISETQET